MITIKAQFDGKVFIPQEPVNLPAGSVCDVTIPQSAPSSPLSTLAKLARIADHFPDNSETPTDLAAQHDHYLYGTSKKP